MTFFSEQPFYGNFSTLDSHTKHCNFSNDCLLVKMALKTVTRSVTVLDYHCRLVKTKFLILGNFSTIGDITQLNLSTAPPWRQKKVAVVEGF